MILMHRYRALSTAISTANHSKEAPLVVKNKKKTKTNNLKGGKTQVTKSRLVLVLNLIGSQNDASFLDQSYNEIEENQSNPRLYSTLN